MSTPGHKNKLWNKIFTGNSSATGLDYLIGWQNIWLCFGGEARKARAREAASLLVLKIRVTQTTNIERGLLSVYGRWEAIESHSPLTAHSFLDFFIPNFFIPSGLGAGTALKHSPVRLRQPRAEPALARQPQWSPLNSGQPRAVIALARPQQNLMTGPLWWRACFASLTVSSPTASSTLRFECLGFEELPEQNQESGKI
jgi:hypothetical protein